MIFVLSRFTALFDLSIRDAGQRVRAGKKGSETEKEREWEAARRREMHHKLSSMPQQAIDGWLGWLATQSTWAARANNINTIQMKITPYCYKSQTDILVIIICIIIIINCGGLAGAHRCRSSRMRENKIAVLKLLLCWRTSGKWRECVGVEESKMQSLLGIIRYMSNMLISSLPLLPGNYYVIEMSRRTSPALLISPHDDNKFTIE